MPIRAGRNIAIRYVNAGSVYGSGLVERVPDDNDGRVVRVRLTKDGDRIVHQLARAHLDRLHELATVLDELVTRHGTQTAAPAAGRLG